MHQRPFIPVSRCALDLIIVKFLLIAILILFAINTKTTLSSFRHFFKKAPYALRKVPLLVDDRLQSILPLWLTQISYSASDSNFLIADTETPLFFSVLELLSLGLAPTSAYN